MVLRTLKEVLNLQVIVQAFHGVVTVLRFGDDGVALSVKEFLLVALVERFGVDIHCRKEVSLFFDCQRLQNLFDHVDVFVLFLGGTIDHASSFELAVLS